MKDTEKLHQKAQVLQERMDKQETKAVKKVSRTQFRLPKQVLENQLYRKRYEMEQEDTSFQTASKSAAALQIVSKELKGWKNDKIKKYKILHIEKLESKALSKESKNNPLDSIEFSQLKSELKAKREKTQVRSLSDLRIRYHEAAMPSRKRTQTVRYRDSNSKKIVTKKISYKVDDSASLHVKPLSTRLIGAGAESLRFKSEQDIMYNEDGNAAAQASVKALKFSERGAQRALHFHKNEKYNHRNKSQQLKKQRQKKLARKRNYKQAYKSPVKRTAARFKDFTKKVVRSAYKVILPILFVLIIIVVIFFIVSQLISMIFGGSSGAAGNVIQNYSYNATVADYTDAVNFWGQCADEYMTAFKHIPDVVENDEWSCSYYKEIKLNAIDSYRLAAVLSCFFNADDFENNLDKVHSFIKDLFYSQYDMTYSVEQENRTIQVQELIPCSEGEISKPYPDNWITVEVIEDEEGTQYYQITRTEETVYKKLRFEMLYNGSMDEIIQNICNNTGDESYLERYEKLMFSYGMMFIYQNPLREDYPSSTNCLDDIISIPGLTVTWEDDQPLTTFALQQKSNSGDLIYCPADGTITDVGDDFIIVKTANGINIQLQGVQNVSVQTSAEVYQGDQIAEASEVLTITIYDDNGYYYNPLYLVDNGCVAIFFKVHKN